MMMGGDHDFEGSGNILEPTEKDVLCGRGGMSNHHQGNEWYRRLIRSNRPLYRACPKHTKLLVSKAIVQAVEEQGGRFLERSRKTGMWYQVPYKRAVDKTSQGLRERDKDDASAPQITSLPLSLRASNGGKVPKPNLSALAQVTMAHAGMPLSSKSSAAKPAPTSSMPKFSGGGGQAQQAMKQQQMKQQQMKQQQQQMQQQQQQMRQQQVQQRGGGGGGGLFNNTMGRSQGGVGAGGTDPLEAPPQPGLLASQSSMFRLLSSFTGGGGRGGNNNNNNRRTSLSSEGGFGQPNPVAPLPSMSGPGLSSFMGFGNSGGGAQSQNNNMMNNINANNMGMGMAGMDMNSNAMNMNSLNGMNGGNTMNSMGNNMGNSLDPSNPNFSMTPQQQQQFQQHMQQQQAQQNAGGGGPTLTRFTSQVSDWLGSFWPVGKGPNAAGGPGNPGGSGAPGAGGLGRGGLQGDRPSNLGNTANNNLGQGNTLDDFSGGNMQNQGANFPNEMPSGNLGGGADQMNAMQNNMMAQMGGGGPGVGVSMMENNMGMPAPMSNNPMGGGGGPGSSRGRRGSAGGNIPPPAGLESSVSTTLLKLASSPSKILAGLSSFFTPEQQSGFDPTHPGQPQQQRQSFTAPTGDPLMDGPPPPPPGALGYPVARRASRRSSDLLDDYEETELEARMRAVNG